MACARVPGGSGSNGPVPATTTIGVNAVDVASSLPELKLRALAKIPTCWPGATVMVARVLVFR